MASWMLRVAWLMTMVCTVSSFLNVATLAADPEEDAREIRRARLESQVLNFQRKHNSNIKQLRGQSQTKHSSDNAMARAEMFSHQAPNASTMDPDMLVKEDFTRRCKFGTTVAHKDFLPQKQLDQFCSEHTDSVVDCKVQMTRMNSLHKRGSDMDIFCLSIFQWFLRKYGQNCPKQCDKTMCRSTCDWISEKKLSDQEGALIEEKLDEAQVTKSRMDTMEDVARTMEKGISRSRDKLHTSKVLLNRTKLKLEAKMQAYILVENEQIAKNGEAVQAKSEMVADEEAMEEANEIYMQAKFLMDKAELELYSLKQSTKREQTALDSLDDGVVAQGERIIKTEKHLQDLAFYKAEDEGKVAQLLPTLSAAETTLNTSNQELESAKSQLEFARANGLDTAVPEVLVRNKRNNVRSNTKIYQKLDMEKKTLDRKIENYARELEVGNLELNATQTEKLRLEALRPAQDQALANATAKETAKQGEVTAAKAAMDTAKANYSTWEDTADEAQKWYKSKLTRQKQAEAATKRAKQAVDRIDSEVYSSEKAILNLEGTLSDMVREYEDNQFLYQALNASFFPEYQALMIRKQIHDDAVTALQARRPEIVVLHRLG